MSPAGLGGVLGGPDDAHDLVDGVERDEEPLDDVQAIRALPSRNSAAPHHDVEAVVDIGEAQVVETERLGLAVDEHHVVDAEALLHGGEAVELGEHGVGVHAGLALDLDAQAVVAVGEVLDLGDAVELAGEHQLLDLGDHPLGADEVGQLGDLDALAAGGDLGDLGPGPDAHAAPPGLVGVAQGRRR
jgi:hypothetical protein